MRKILLLLIILTFTSCEKTFKSDDVFIIYAKENRDTTYKYLYRVRHYSTTMKKNGLFYVTDYAFVSNDDYELDDTITFVNLNTYKKLTNED